MENKTALITGASSGIGREVAKILSKERNTLILVSRSQNRLQELKKELEGASPVNIKLVVKDLSETGAAEDIYREIENEHITVDTLVNIAGFGNYGPFAGTSWRKEADMLAVNIAALTQLTKLFIKGMVERKQGRIMNVSSTAAFQPGPMMAVYYASKAYVLSFSQAVAKEVEGTGVTVTALCPGPTATGFAKAAGMEHVRLFRYKNPASPADVARYGCEAMMKGKTVAIPGLLNRIMAFSTRFASRNLLLAIVGYLHGPA
jgi:short-subunit dehydrogenase